LQDAAEFQEHCNRALFLKDYSKTLVAYAFFFVSKAAFGELLMLWGLHDAWQSERVPKPLRAI
jgi:hypothetical protein